jgi:hypothetical protein
MIGGIVGASSVALLGSFLPQSILAYAVFSNPIGVTVSTLIGVAGFLAGCYSGNKV